jgi:outer membrane protein TolC
MQRKDTRRRWPWWSLCGILLTAGCHSIPPAESLARAQRQDDGPIRQAQHRRHLPDAPPTAPLTPPTAGRPIPLSLDAVLATAQDHNGQVRLARLKVDEAFADQEAALKHWLPDLSVGMSTWRHDGGIQDFQGNLLNTHYGGAFGGLELNGKYDWKEILVRRVEAERKFWQQKGELSKLTSENMLDASSTYIDLLSARTGILISQEIETRLNDLLQQAEALARIDPGLRVEVTRVRTEMIAQNILTVKLREATKAASAKLAYLLGLDPRSELLPLDPRLVPLRLVDPSATVDAFVEQALNRGPGIKELEGLLHTVEAARNSNYGWQHWVPSINVCMQEGAFGAGPGTQINWTNTFNMNVHLLWNLNDYVYARYKRQQADMHIKQVQMSYQDLQLKLTLGVQEAREAILGFGEQVHLAEAHITNAEESYRLSDQRLKQNIKGRSTSEVLLALRSLGGARLEYLQAVRDLDKAQLRLFALIGTTEAPDCKK